MSKPVDVVADGEDEEFLPCPEALVREEATHMLCHCDDSDDINEG